MDSDAWVGIECDVAEDVAMAEAVKTVGRPYGGLAIIIDNVGVFPKSGTL